LESRLESELNSTLEPVFEVLSQKILEENEKAKQETNDTENDEKPESKNTFYTELRGDRSGSVLTDILHADAFAFHHNMTYEEPVPGSSS
jgi:hypothetical protein